MVGTRRRSVVTKEDVEAAMEAMDSTRRSNRRVSEIGGEDSVSRTRSPTTCSASTDTKSSRKKSPENKRLTAAVLADDLPTASPSSRTKSPRTSASSVSSRTGSSPAPKRTSASSRTLEAAERPATSSTRAKRLSESQQLEEAERPATPTRRAKRLSESLKSETVERPATPSTRAKRLSESQQLEATERPATPTRRAKRLSESLQSEMVERPATPTGRAKRLSESSRQLTASPSRRSRRLSGTGPEEVTEQPVLPLKKRRTSMTTEEDRTDVEKCDSTNKSISSTVTPEVTVPPPPSETNLDAITEEEDETAGEAEVVGQTKQPPTTLDVIKEDEENTSEMSAANSQQIPDSSQQSISKHQSETQDAASQEVINEKCISDKDSTVTSTTTGDVNGTTTGDNKEKSTEVVDIKKPALSAEEELLKTLQMALVKPIPRQKPKSGRFWKAERSKFRLNGKDKGNRKTFEQRMKQKEERERNRDMANQIIQEKNLKKEELRKRIEENKKRREENQLKSEVYQVVRNPNKIKKMKKKDLAKRDILAKHNPV